jgi:hypothetical protein
MSDDCSANPPSDFIELNGHSYILEATVQMWGCIEIMVRNPAVAERISDLEARLEKAEAERDAAQDESVTLLHEVTLTRNLTLEEAAEVIDLQSASPHWGNVLRALKTP